jgi:hypothetical protein
MVRRLPLALERSRPGSRDPLRNHRNQQHQHRLRPFLPLVAAPRRLFQLTTALLTFQNRITSDYKYEHPRTRHYPPLER